MNSLKAVVLDWAGTVVDTGSRAPMGVFVEVFARFGVEITIAEARGPMGMAKLEHIRALGALPRIAAAWAACWEGCASDCAGDEPAAAAAAAAATASCAAATCCGCATMCGPCPGA
jgi:beta-phosphoglucomutase-like phosphatase (HAD superfamily)